MNPLTRRRGSGRITYQEHGVQPLVIVPGGTGAGDRLDEVFSSEAALGLDRLPDRGER